MNIAIGSDHRAVAHHHDPVGIVEDFTKDV